MENPPPEFPKGAAWLNGKPLTWNALRGQVVILDFWAEWCGPCRNDLPQLSQLHDDRQNNGLTIIGVHLSGSKLSSIKKAIKQLKIDYPICVDIARSEEKADDEDFPSQFSSQFAIDAIPHFVVVDQQGIVKASISNRFNDALTIAEQLVKNPTSEDSK